MQDRPIDNGSDSEQKLFAAQNALGNLLLDALNADLINIGKYDLDFKGYKKDKPGVLCNNTSELLKGLVDKLDIISLRNPQKNFPPANNVKPLKLWTTNQQQAMDNGQKTKQISEPPSLMDYINSILNRYQTYAVEILTIYKKIFISKPSDKSKERVDEKRITLVLQFHNVARLILALTNLKIKINESDLDVDASKKAILHDIREINVSGASGTNGLKNYDRELTRWKGYVALILTTELRTLYSVNDIIELISVLADAIGFKSLTKVEEDAFNQEGNDNYKQLVVERKNEYEGHKSKVISFINTLDPLFNMDMLLEDLKYKEDENGKKNNNETSAKALFTAAFGNSSTIEVDLKHGCKLFTDADLLEISLSYLNKTSQDTVSTNEKNLTDNIFYIAYEKLTGQQYVESNDFSEDRLKQDCEILGITTSATYKEFKQAYNKKALQFHPDKNPEDAEVFRKVTEAYKNLYAYFELLKTKQQVAPTATGNPKDETSVKPATKGTDQTSHVIVVAQQGQFSAPQHKRQENNPVIIPVERTDSDAEIQPALDEVENGRDTSSKIKPVLDNQTSFAIAVIAGQLHEMVNNHNPHELSYISADYNKLQIETLAAQLIPGEGETVDTILTNYKEDNLITEGQCKTLTETFTRLTTNNLQEDILKALNNIINDATWKDEGTTFLLWKSKVPEGIELLRKSKSFDDMLDIVSQRMSNASGLFRSDKTSDLYQVILSLKTLNHEGQLALIEEFKLKWNDAIKHLSQHVIK